MIHQSKIIVLCFQNFGQGGKSNIYNRRMRLAKYCPWGCLTSKETDVFTNKTLQYLSKIKVCFDCLMLKNHICMMHLHIL